MVDLTLAFNVSSDAMVDIGEHGEAGQVGDICYGPLVNHLTVSPIWLLTEGCLVTVTIVCPDN